MQDDHLRSPTTSRWCGLAALVVLGWALLGPAEARAAVLLVPSQYPTIQAAIDAATAGDTVRVADDTYYENIDFLGKAITVESVNGPVFTTIDGGGLGSVVTITSGGPDSVLKGFTIINGVGVLCPGGALPQCGGGVYVSSASPTITENVFNGNVASWRGGAIFCFESEAMIDGNTFEGNSSGEAGGAVYFRESACVIANNVFIGNVTSGAGGAVGILNPSAPFAITDNLFVDNQASANPDEGAGAVGCWTWPVGTLRPGGVILRNDFVGNSSDGYDGALGVWRMQSVEVADNLFQDNTAVMWGGAVGCYRSTDTTITGNRFGGNVATLGGAIDVVESALTTLSNNTFWDNEAGSFGGAILFQLNSQTVLTSSTFWGNQAGGSGGAILADSNTEFTVANTILWNNVAPAGPQMTEWTGLLTVISSCCIEGGYVGGVDIIDAPPLLVDPDLPDPDFHLEPDSPCVDTGDDTVPGLPAIDFDGDPRIVCGLIDIGADEVLPPGGVCPPLFVRGDVNQDATLDISDAITGLDILFGGAPMSSCPASVDANDDDLVDIGDAIFILSLLFVPGSPLPPPPFPDCGPDPTPGALGCAAHAACP